MRAAAAVLLVAAASAQQSAPGISASVATAGLQYALNTALPIVEGIIDRLDIPYISFVVDSFNASLSNFACSNFSVPVGNVLMGNDTGIGIQLAGIELQCGGDWAFYQVDIHIPSGGGSFTALVAETGASLAVDVTLDASGHAVLAARDVAFTIGTVDVNFSGSAWDWLINLLKSTIINALTGALTNAFDNGITALVDDTLNAALANSTYALPLGLPAPYNELEWRFGLASSPVFNGSYFGLPFLGDVVAANNPVAAPITPPALPGFNPAYAARYVQAYVSAYTPMSALYVLYTSDLLTWLLPPTALPLGLNNTAAYSLIAPGMAAAYPGGQVWIYVLASDMPVVDISAATGITVTAPLLLGFNVNTTDWNNDTTNAFALDVGLGLSVNLSIVAAPDGTSQAIVGDIRYVSANISVASTNVGPVSTGLLQAAIDLLFNGVVVPAINALLSGGIPLPSSPLFSLADTILSVQDGYVQLGSNFTLPQLEVAAAAAAAAAAAGAP